MTNAEIIMAIAVVTGPIAAVLISLWQTNRTAKRSEERKRKEDLFKTLMATRANRLSQEHVRALNLIDVSFTKKEQRVLDAWKVYLDYLTPHGPEESRPSPEVWTQRSNDLFIDMLYEMSIALGYTFDKVLLNRQAYSPVAHGEIERLQKSTLEGLSQVFSWQRPIPIAVVPLTPPTPEQERTGNADLEATKRVHNDDAPKFGA
ncbi:MAG: DUF6680 family protein [Thermodesulfobacteriota bacterium]